MLTSLPTGAQIGVTVKEGDWFGFTLDNGRQGFVFSTLLCPCAPTESTPATPITTVATTPAEVPSEVSWDEARQFAGAELAVCGPVVETVYAKWVTGAPTFLYLGGGITAPQRFTVVIWDQDRDAFPADPHDYYLGRTICARGKVRLLGDLAEMTIRSSEEIE
jgi:hypothetical protein